MKMLSVLILVAGLPFFAIAEQHDGPCKQDRETLCKDAKRGRAAMKCLRDNKDKLSPACKEHIESMKEHMKEAKEACHEDVEKFCGDVEKGGGRVMKCMKEHKSELSEACRKSMKK